MAVKKLPVLSELPEPPDRLVGDQERFDVLTFNSLKAQKKMVNEDLNKTLIPALNEFAVDVNAGVDAAALSERNAAASEQVAVSKAGEAAGSAQAAKVSEDNAKVSEKSAAASKTAAAKSAADAEAARTAAEAARDEAQDLANVGYASKEKVGLAKVDGKTTQADAGGMITVKDVAIGGNLADLASARGQIGNSRAQGAHDFSSGMLNENPGMYTAINTGSTNVPFVGPFAEMILGSTQYRGSLLMTNGRPTLPRAAISTINTGEGGGFSGYNRLITEQQIGDGITNINGIISVPEYDGATALTAGTSGLVPPATAGQQESFLTGGGEYKPALTKISDSVSSTDSTTAASAKAVKTAYDLANSKQANLGFTPVQQGGGAGQEGNKIYIGWSAAGLKAQADALDLGNIVTTSAGCTKAPSAATADRLRRADGVDTLWNWAGQPGQPPYVWGSNDGINMLVWNPANFSVAYASSAGSANMKVYAAWHSNAAAALPAGGTWIWIKYANYPDRYNYCNAGTAAGGTWIGNESGIGGNTSGVSICAFQIAA